MLETEIDEDVPALRSLGDVIVTAEPGFVQAYVTYGRNVPARAVTLRQVSPDTDLIYGDHASDIRSEACMMLDLGEGRLPRAFGVRLRGSPPVPPRTRHRFALVLFGGIRTADVPLA